MKKIFIIIVSFIIAFCPCVALCDFSYAADTPSSGGGAWVHPSTHEEVVAAFKAYCKTRNYQNLHSSELLQAIVAFDYDQFEKNCALLNIDPDGLNAEIWYSYTKSPKYLKWFFNQSAMGKFNQIYGSILAEHNMQYDNPEEKVIYSGVWVEDDYGNGTYCYILDSSRTSQSWNSTEFLNATKGSIYIPEEYGKYIYNNVITQEGSIMAYNARFDGVDYDYYLKNMKIGSEPGIFCHGSTDFPTSSNPKVIYRIRSIAEQNGYITIAKNGVGRYFISAYYKQTYKDGSNPNYAVFTLKEIFLTNPINNTVTADQGEAVQPVTNKSLEITTNVTSIENYIINDSHDTYNYGDDEEPDEEPKQKPVPPDSTTPNPTNPSIDTGNPNFSFQMPDINIDWNLDLDPDNLPFPFSIPNDIYNAFDSLNVEAEAPHFEGTVDLYVCQWDIDIDFDQFADLANIFNKWFLFVYVVGLIIATRSLMHIY